MTLAKAFPEDYGRSAAPARSFDRLRTPIANFPDPEGLLAMDGPSREHFGALIEENDAVRTQLRELIPET